MSPLCLSVVPESAPPVGPPPGADPSDLSEEVCAAEKLMNITVLRG